MLTRNASKAAERSLLKAETNKWRDPRSGEEAVYPGFGLEQTQRGARRVGLTNNAHQLSQEPKRPRGERYYQRDQSG